MPPMPRLLLLLLLAASAWAAPLRGEERDASRDAVANLEAYAVYKMGKYEEARRRWEVLAERGNTTALINLANLFQQGQGVTEDRRRAIDYVRKAAELGDRRAQYELGIAYERGDVLGRDIGRAGEWLKRSAEQDHAEGQFAYGVLLATGRGRGIEAATPAERAEALSWLRKASDNGSREAGDYIRILEEAG